jgi:hypothetical protein
MNDRGNAILCQFLRLDGRLPRLGTRPLRRAVQVVQVGCRPNSLAIPWREHTSGGIRMRWRCPAASARRGGVTRWNRLFAARQKIVMRKARGWGDIPPRLGRADAVDGLRVAGVGRALCRC